MLLGALRQVFFFQVACCLRMLALLVGQLVQQFARGCIRRSRDRSLIKALRLQFHHLRLSSCHVHAQRTNQPIRPALQKPFHVLAPDQRNVVAKALPERGQQPVPMHRLFLAHLFEHLRRRRIAFAQRVGKLPVNAPILFLRRDRQRQNLFLTQILELFQHSPSLA